MFLIPYAMEILYHQVASLVRASSRLRFPRDGRTGPVYYGFDKEAHTDAHSPAFQLFSPRTSSLLAFPSVTPRKQRSVDPLSQFAPW
jgi:hypothetical protein